MRRGEYKHINAVTCAARFARPIRVGRFIVGEVRGDTFYKRLARVGAFLNVPPAIGFDISSLHDAERRKDWRESFGADDVYPGSLGIVEE